MQRDGLLREIDMVRDANRALEKQNETLAANSMRARTAVQDVEVCACACECECSCACSCACACACAGACV